MGTTLRNGGSPWSPEEVDRLKLARALLREPPLLVVDIATVPLDGILADYPGVVVSTTPLQDGNTIDWNLDT